MKKKSKMTAPLKRSWYLCDWASFGSVYVSGTIEIPFSKRKDRISTQYKKCG